MGISIPFTLENSFDPALSNGSNSFQCIVIIKDFIAVFVKENTNFKPHQRVPRNYRKYTKKKAYATRLYF